MKKWKKSKIITIAILSLSFLLILGIYVWHEEHRAHILEIYFLNLKSGSSIFIRTPNDKRILINGGANSEIIRELTKILPFYSRRIDTLIATDDLGKDITGLIEVLSRYSVNRVIIPAFDLQTLNIASSTDEIFSTLVSTIHQKNINLDRVMAGDRINLDDTTSGNENNLYENVIANVLFPFATSTFQYSKASSPELVFKMRYGVNSILFLGNVTTKIQKSIASSTDFSQSKDLFDVLFIPHNVSSDSLAQTLMNIMKPKYLVYSKAISNSSKMSTSPKPDPLYSVLEDHRFNTKEGTVKLISDGENIGITNK